MGTKFFLKFIYSSNARISNDMDYMKIELPIDEFQDIHAITTPPLLMNMIMSALLLIMDKMIIMMVLMMTSFDLCLALIIFGIASGGMMLATAYKAESLLSMFNL